MNEKVNHPLPGMTTKIKFTKDNSTCSVIKLCLNKTAESGGCVR